MVLKRIVIQFFISQSLSAYCRQYKTWNHILIDKNILLVNVEYFTATSKSLCRKICFARKFKTVPKYLENQYKKTLKKFNFLKTHPYIDIVLYRDVSFQGKSWFHDFCKKKKPLYKRIGKYFVSGFFKHFRIFWPWWLTSVIMLVGISLKHSNLLVYAGFCATWVPRGAEW